MPEHLTDREPPPIAVQNLRITYGEFLIQQDLNFSVQKGEIFVIMGGSGCGKTTVMRCITGLKEPDEGNIFVKGTDIWKTEPEERALISSRFGIVYQSGALWSSMTLAENIGLPLGEYTDLSAKEIRELASFKLSLVGLAGFEDYYPSEISGGMRKRAGVARALAMDPDILFFDEPSAGLDPVTSALLDDLILQLRDSLGITMMMVTHELPSIFSIADNAVFLDAETKTMLTSGNPKYLLKHSENEKVQAFLTRSSKSSTAGPV